MPRPKKTETETTTKTPARRGRKPKDFSKILNELADMTLEAKETKPAPAPTPILPAEVQEQQPERVAAAYVSREYVDGIIKGLDKIIENPEAKIGDQLQAYKLKIEILRVFYNKKQDAIVTNNAVYKWKTVESEATK